jgi:Spy/CpxP family protein refolding chaperone
MGLARPAELNGYPGPRHVLDLADSLDLTAEQRGTVEEIFRAMNARAVELGREVLAAERELDAAFASGRVTGDALAAIVDRIGDLQAELRTVHLRAHLATRAILTDHQVHEYDRLRGYGAGHPTGAEAGHIEHPDN